MSAKLLLPTPLPTRRAALAAALGVVAAGLTAAHAAPAKPPVPTRPRPASYVLDDDKTPLTPAQRQRRDVAFTVILTSSGELADALDAVLDALDGEDSDWADDVASLWFYAERFVSITESEALHPIRAAADAERERRRQAFARGAVYHACPVLWGERALAAATADLKSHGEDLAGDLAVDARYHHWLLRLGEGSYHNESHLRMNDAARKAKGWPSPAV